MVTYVEQAILRVTDQSTRQINNVNRSLAALFRTARAGAGIRNINITFNLRNINQTIAKVQQLDRLLRGLSRRMPPIGPGWGGGGGAGGGAGGGGNRGAGGRTGNNRYDFGPGFTGGVMAGPILDPFTLGRMLSYIVVGQLYMQASNVVISGAQSALTAQALTTTQNLTLAPANIPLVNAAAVAALTQVEGLSINDLTKLYSNIALSIPAAGPNFARIALAAAQAEERIYAVTPDRAESATSILAKVLEFAQISEDPARAEAIMRGYAAGIGATGATFSPESFLAALRVSGTALTLDEQGIFNFMLAFDEGGRRVGDNTNRMLTALTQEAGVSQAQTDMLTASGIIGPNGRPVQEELLLANQQAWVQAVIRPLLLAQGVDPTDNIAVRIALQEMGFVTREMRQVAQEIAAGEERYFSAWQAAQSGMVNAVTGSQRDLGQSLRNLFASFSTMSVDTLVPLFERLAGPVDRLANWMESFYGPAKSLSGEFAKLSERTQQVSAAVAGLVLGFWTIKSAIFGLRLLGFITGASMIGRAAAGGAATLAGTGPLIGALAINTGATKANTAMLLACGCGGTGGVPPVVPPGGQPPRRWWSFLPAIGGWTAGIAAALYATPVGLGSDRPRTALEARWDDIRRRGRPSLSPAAEEAQKRRQDMEALMKPLVASAAEIIAASAVPGGMADLPVDGAAPDTIAAVASAMVRLRDWAVTDYSEMVMESNRKITAALFDDRKDAIDTYQTGREAFVNRAPIDGISLFTAIFRELTGHESAPATPSSAASFDPSRQPPMSFPNAADIADRFAHTPSLDLARIYGSVFREVTGQSQGLYGTNNTADTFADVFSQSAFELMQVGPTIENAAAQFGPIAGQGMLSSAAQFGAIAGAAAAAAMGGVTITARAPATPDPAVNLGGSGPF